MCPAVRSERSAPSTQSLLFAWFGICTLLSAPACSDTSNGLSDAGAFQDGSVDGNSDPGASQDSSVDGNSDTDAGPLLRRQFIVGDWDRGSRDLAGVYDPKSGWHLRHDHDSSSGWTTIKYGLRAEPVVGDWYGEGIDRLGYRTGNTFHLAPRAEPVPPVPCENRKCDELYQCDGSNVCVPEEIVFSFGEVGAPFWVGDWDGDGVDEVGIIEGTELVSRGVSPAFDRRPIDKRLLEAPFFVGDWNGDGRDSPGQKVGKEWRLYDDFLATEPRATFAYGLEEDTPVTGDWDGDGADDIGVIRDEAWLLRHSQTGGDANLEYAFAPAGEMENVQWPPYVVTTNSATPRGIEVYDLTAQDWDADGALQWRWSGIDNIEGAAGEWVQGATDVKLKRHGKVLLVASNQAGGVAMLRASDRKPLFYAQVPGNCHSIELLPDGNLVSASSKDFLRLIATDSGDFVDIRFRFAHGVVWDPKRLVLWAIGEAEDAYAAEIAAFAYGGTKSKPTLTPIYRVQLPTPWGHDLYPLPNVDRMYATTNAHVYEFDPHTGNVLTVEQKLNLPRIKSIGKHPTTGQVMVVQSFGGGEWWSDTIQLFNPDETRTRTDGRFYKARFLVPTLP